ncbi:MAG: glycoside hydrolase family 3 protein [Prevotella sp.]|jgi:beta-glucosidase|nr:glycoside hydrolase family 3 protein [Prevotella sp.]MCI1281879.1 glycoside hydrolase family 3 protein [Prevotella sp.]
MKKYYIVLSALIFCTSLSFAQKKSDKSFITITQKSGKTLGYSPSSGVKIITVDGLKFKDLNRNGKLDKYEDWRLPALERATDLAHQLSIEEIAGLMLYSAHQAIPANEVGFGSGTYGGKPFSKSGAKASDLSDAQKQFLTNDNLRHVLITSVKSPAIAAEWNNNVQALCEGYGHGIPANNSSDPRNGTTANTEYNAGSGGTISQWPGQLGLAATFDPLIVKEFGRIASHEYRALGIATALSPQIDIASEPRWSRVNGTFGEDPALAVDMARAYCDGFQSSEDNHGGWGMFSVNTMIKHWPGGGPEEGGRDGHFGYGKYAVYPGNNFSTMLRPFTEGALKLQDGTEMAASVMPYYTISYNQNGGNGSNRGNSYNKYVITDLLRDKYHFEGVVCTDWMVTADVSGVSKFEGKCWGAEDLNVAQRHYEILKSGVDQFGGNNDKEPVLKAYQMWKDEYGVASARQRFESSAVRLLVNIFRTGLFENPYLDPSQSAAVVGCPAYMKAGYEAQLKSIVMLKNKANILPLKSKKLKVFVPKRFVKGVPDWWGNTPADKTDYPVNIDLVKKYFTVVDTPVEADFALVFIESPNGGTGYSDADRKQGGNGYMPISLQYGSYTASTAREQSIAGGGPDEDFTNRSYRGKTVTAYNSTDADLVKSTRQQMGNKPVILSVKCFKPCVLAEVEPSADAIVVDFETQAQAVMDIISGKAEPSGLLPMQFPADMLTVEAQKEDVPRDMTPYTDTLGHKYDFAFGLNWSGVINDARVNKYK